MPDLFGIDMAGLLADSFAGAGGLVPGTLVTETNSGRTPGSLTDGIDRTDPVTHTFQGFLEEGEKRMSETRVTVQGTFITMLGATISPAIVPAVGNRATIEGAEFELTELVERDPAAATYVFRVKG